MSYDLFKLESLSIELDKPDCSYYAGDTVKGHVEVEISEVVPEDEDPNQKRKEENPKDSKVFKCYWSDFKIWMKFFQVS